MNTEEIQQAVESVIPVVSQYGLKILGAFAILVIGWMVAGWVKRTVRRGLDKLPRMDETLKPFIASGARYLILVFVIVGVLNQFGVETTSIIAVLGAAGLAIGLALQGTLSNVAAGVMLLLLRPFKTGEYIEAGGVAGTVKEIGLFSTEFATPQGICVLAPNASLWGASITNHSRNPTRRADISVGIAYGDDISAARKALMDLMTGDERVNNEPAPQVLVTLLGDSSVNLQMRCWANGDVFWPLYFDLTENCKATVEGVGCSIPFPQRDVHMIPAKD